MRTEFALTSPQARTADTAPRRNLTPGPRSEHASDRAFEVAAAKAAARAEQAAAANEAALKAAREQANQALAGNSRELAFELDDGSGRVVVKLIDTRTNEVLRQMPTEEMLAISRALKDGAETGALLNTDA